MRVLIESLVERIDLAESQSPHGYGWKNLFDQIIAANTALTNSAEAQQAMVTNPLFGLLAKQNRLLVTLLLLVLVSGLEIQKG